MCDSRGLAADLPVVPLLAVGEVLLVGSFELLHGTHIGPGTEPTRTKIRSGSTPGHLNRIISNYLILGWSWENFWYLLTLLIL